MPQLYDGADFRLTVNGEVLDCRVTFSMPESTEMVQSQTDDGWQRFRPNNQGLQVNVSGIDLGAWEYLKSQKNIGIPVAFRLQTNDGEIVELGTGWISDLSRIVSEGKDTEFNATIVAIGPVENTTQFSFLLLEDGDYVLLESGDRIKN